jgi:hypothetical protein
LLSACFQTELADEAVVFIGYIDVIFISVNFEYEQVVGIVGADQFGSVSLIIQDDVENTISFRDHVEIKRVFG